MPRKGTKTGGVVIVADIAIDVEKSDAPEGDENPDSINTPHSAKTIDKLDAPEGDENCY